MLPYRRCLLVILSMVMTAEVTFPEPALADVVGLVKRVKGDAFGTPPQSVREQKFPRFPVAQRELLETDSGSGMFVEFLDKTTLTLGPDSSLAIDAFVYDPKSHRGTSVINLAVGMLRFVSGEMASGDVKIKTPSAIIGIRGSDALIVVSETGATRVSVFSGRFSIADLEGKGETSVTAAQSVSVSVTGAISAVEPGPPEPPSEIDVPAPSRPGPGTGADPGHGGGDKVTDYSPSLGLGKDHPGDGGGGDSGHDDHDDHHDDDDGFDSRGFGDDDGHGNGHGGNGGNGH